jgi:transcription factor IIIB 90 kDa subunit
VGFESFFLEFINSTAIMPLKKPPPVVNPLRNRPSINAPTAFPKRATTPRATKRTCPNPSCPRSDIQDGTCHGCGWVVEEFNIVAEVQFGETSNGAAVVQGSFVGADQGTARTQGPGFARMGGQEGRDVTISEGKTPTNTNLIPKLTCQGTRIMRTMAAQLPVEVPPYVVESGGQIFKIAAMNNFIQGRRMDMVAAVCLYSAMRKEPKCTVMLIDFADLCQVRPFFLSPILFRY